MRIITLFFLLLTLAACSGGGQQAQSQSSCVAAYEAAYAGQWSEMNRVQRAAVGLQAASCGGGE